MSSRPSTTWREGSPLVDLIPLVVYLVALGTITWLHDRKVSRLEKQVKQQKHVITGLGLALAMHLKGEAVQLHMIPLRLDEEE